MGQLTLGRLFRLAGLVPLVAALAAGGRAAWAGDDRWTSTGGPPGLVYSLALDPVAQGVLYAGTSTAGVFKSTDGGQSWASVNQGLGSKAVFSLALDPTRPTILYAGTNQGVYRSEDGALSWKASSSGLPKDLFGSTYVYALVVDPARPATLYAGTQAGVFKSRDGGQTWQVKNTGLRIGFKPIFAEALAVDALSANVLYAGVHYQGLGGTLYKTQDGGEGGSPWAWAFPTRRSPP